MEGTQRVRLFVGGLGASVGAEDLKRAFGSLGNVSQVELIRSKDRDFAYLDFEASSAAALRKVFSTYKGCKWKGGCLRVEEAKESPLTRLQREWEAEAKPKPVQEEEEKEPAKFNPTQEMKLFFPRLRKVKGVPVRGTGKHKKSFERWNSQPLALLKLCSCEGHGDEAVDPFDYEHNAYLQLIDKLEGGESKQEDKSEEKDESSEKRSRKKRRTEKVEKDDTQVEAVRSLESEASKQHEASAPENKPKAQTEDDESKPEDEQDDRNQNSKNVEDSEGSGKRSVKKRRTAKAEAAESLEAEINNSSEPSAPPKPQTKWDKIFEAAAGLADEELDEEMDMEKVNTDAETVRKSENVPSEAKTEPEESSAGKRKKVRFMEETITKKVDSKDSKDSEDDGSQKQDTASEGEKQAAVKSQWLQVSSWTSLVGDGAATFTLGSVSGPKAEAPSTPVVWGETKAVASTGSSDEKKADERKNAAGNKQVEKKEKPSSVPIRSLLEKKTCSFMRSSNAEEEWLASRKKLKSDFISKHKAALRNRRKTG